MSLLQSSCRDWILQTKALSTRPGTYWATNNLCFLSWDYEIGEHKCPALSQHFYWLLNEWITLLLHSTPTRPSLGPQPQEPSLCFHCPFPLPPHISPRIPKSEKGTFHSNSCICFYLLLYFAEWGSPPSGPTLTILGQKLLFPAPSKPGLAKNLIFLQLNSSAVKSSVCISGVFCFN